MNKGLIKNKYFWAVIFFMVTAFALRMLFSQLFGSYWFDEYYSVYPTKFSLGKMLGLFMMDVNLPLYQILLWLWVRIFNESETVVRLLSIFFAMLNVPLLYLVGKKLFSKQAAIIALIFYTFSTYQISLTTEVRTYSLLVFLGLLATFFFWELVKGKRTFGRWAGYIISLLLLAYTHLTGWLLILAQAIFVLIYFWKQRNKSRTNLARDELKSWFISYLIVVLLTVPYLLLFYLNKKETVFSVYLFSVPYDFHFFTFAFKNFFGAISNSFYFKGLIAILPLFILGSFLVIKRLPRQTQRLTEWKGIYDFRGRVKCPAGTAYSLLVAAVLLIGCFAVHWVTPRYLILAAVFIYLLIGQGIVNWFGSKRLLKIILVLLIVSVLISGYGTFFTKSNEWVRVDKCLNQMSQPNSKIIVHNFAFEMMLKKYYTGNLPFEGFYPLKNSLSFEERIIRDNGRPIVTKDNVNQLADFAAGYDNVLLVQVIYVPILDPDKKVMRWFLDNGWGLQDNFCQVGRIYVFNFKKATI